MSKIGNTFVQNTVITEAALCFKSPYSGQQKVFFPKVRSLKQNDRGYSGDGAMVLECNYTETVGPRREEGVELVTQLWRPVAPGSADLR